MNQPYRDLFMELTTELIQPNSLRTIFFTFLLALASSSQTRVHGICNGAMRMEHSRREDENSKGDV